MSKIMTEEARRYFEAAAQRAEAREERRFSREAARAQASRTAPQPVRPH